MKNTIVTAADAFYFRTFCQFAYSFRSEKEYQNSELICYDLGFDESQRAYLDKLMLKTPGMSVRKFNFDSYPDFVGLAYKTYSFKPIIFREVFEEKKGNLLWLDSATILKEPLSYVWEQLDEHGLYAPIGGSGTLKEWTVQETLDYMKVPEDHYLKRNICGCMFGFSFTNETIQHLVQEWERYSLVHECIKPKGAGRSNHRDDQSLLTILLYKYQEKEGIFLTTDEVNISSQKPVSYISVRNKLNPKFPYGLDFLSIFYFNLHGRLDVIINKLKT